MKIEIAPRELASVEDLARAVRLAMDECCGTVETGTWKKGTGMSNHRSVCALVVLSATALLLALVPAAQAHVPETLVEHQQAGIGFRGWGYAYGASDVNAWRWTQAGWSSASLPGGAGIYVYPWTTDWVWAWRGGAWYAIRRSSAAQWNCSTPGVAHRYRVSEQLGAVRFPTNGLLVGILYEGSVVDIVCDNTFKDATVATLGSSVTRSPGPGCERDCWPMTFPVDKFLLVRVVSVAQCRPEVCNGPSPAVGTSVYVWSGPAAQILTNA